MPPVEHFLNGRPGLVDHLGRPIPDSRRDEAAGIALPHVMTFVGRFSGASRTYLHGLYDEAVKHSREDAEAMPRDAYLLALLQERTTAASTLPWHLEVPDDRDPEQAAVKDCVTRTVRGIASFDRMIWWWLQALWFGRYGVQVEPAWGPPPSGRGSRIHDKYRPKRVLTIRDCWPVNGDKIGHSEDHTPYVLINSAAANSLGRADVISTPRGQALSLRGTWRERFLIHKHLMEDADFFNPEQAEAVHGVGIRSKLFWSNFLRMEWLGNITSFFDRVGLGVTIWTFPAGNAKAEAAVKAAAAQQSDRANIFVPVDPDDDRRKGTGIERMEVPTSGADVLDKLIDRLEKHMERYVVGQEASSAGSSTGLGSDAGANIQADTKRNIQVQDARFLAQSITGTEREPGLVGLIKKYTFPHADFPLTFVFDVEKTESEAKLRSAKALMDMGLELKESEVLAAGGFSKPIDGDDVVKAQPQGQPGGPPGAPGAAPPGAPGGEAPPGGPGAGGPMGDLMAGLTGGDPDEGQPEEGGGDAPS